MAIDNKDKIITHLEFLGFELEDLEGKNGYLALVTSEGDRFVVLISGNRTLFTSRWNGLSPKALKSHEFHHELNKINQSVYSKWYYEEKTEADDLVIVSEADYYGYDKTSFGVFFETYKKECNEAGVGLFAFIKNKK